MYFIISLSLFLVLISYLDSRKFLSHGLEIVFVVLTIVSAIRYNYGNDYMSYLRMFENCNSTYRSIFDFLPHILEVDECGWTLLSLLCRPVGFYGFAALHAILVNYLYYHFIKKNVPRHWQWLAVFVYLFSSSFYLLHFSMMRQSLAIAIILNSIQYVFNKKIFKSICCVLIAFSIHKSALFFLPFVFSVYLPFKNSKLLVFQILLVTFLLFVSKDLINMLFSQVISLETFEGYEAYSQKNQTQVSIGLGTLYDLFIFIWSLYFLSKSNNISSPNQKLIVFFSSFHILLIPFQLIIPLITRLSLYFSCFTIALYPILLGTVKSRIYRSLLLLLIIFIIFFRYFQFWAPDSVYHLPYLHYSTIFSINNGYNF